MEHINHTYSTYLYSKLFYVHPYIYAKAQYLYVPVQLNFYIHLMELHFYLYLPLMNLDIPLDPIETSTFYNVNSIKMPLYSESFHRLHTYSQKPTFLMSHLHFPNNPHNFLMSMVKHFLAHL